MKTIIFVCHGSICRSPAAEFIAKDFLRKSKRFDEFKVYSRAISEEEIGNDIYPPMKIALKEADIPFENHYAKLISQNDFKEADYIFYMDEENKNYLDYYFGNNSKIMPIYKFTEGINHIEDPWYTDNFELVVSQIQKCIKDIFSKI